VFLGEGHRSFSFRFFLWGCVVDLLRRSVVFLWVGVLLGDSCICCGWALRRLLLAPHWHFASLPSPVIWWCCEVWVLLLPPANPPSNFTVPLGCVIFLGPKSGWFRSFWSSYLVSRLLASGIQTDEIRFDHFPPFTLTSFL